MKHIRLFENFDINEKAVSAAQQRLMGQAYAYKMGKLKDKDLNPKFRDAIKGIAKNMKPDELKKFAKTKHKGLPKKVVHESLVNESWMAEIDIVRQESKDKDDFKKKLIDFFKESKRDDLADDNEWIDGFIKMYFEGNQPQPGEKE